MLVWQWSTYEELSRDDLYEILKVRQTVFAVEQHCLFQDDDGFKVRTPDATLLWKIKLYEDKIKISDNEENRNPWVLKTGYPDKAKVLDPYESEIGVVRFATDQAPLRVRDASGNDAWIVESGPASASWGVLLMGAIPEEQKAIIIAELISRKR